MNKKTVFISYSHRDLRPDWLHAFASALQDRNVIVWLDEWEVNPGDQIAEKVDTALRTSDAIIAIVSGSPIQNPNVYLGVGAAIGAEKRLILVVDPAYATSIPVDLQQRQWVPLRAPEETAREVAEAVQEPPPRS
jgi:hypothetical protein